LEFKNFNVGILKYGYSKVDGQTTGSPAKAHSNAFLIVQDGDLDDWTKDWTIDCLIVLVMTTVRETRSIPFLSYCVTLRLISEDSC
jgi:hypothetical protein